MEFVSTGKCEQAFAGLKKCVLVAPILREPNWDLPFHIATDASDTAMGDVQYQLEDIKPYSIYYISKNLTPTELHCSVTKKEFIIVVHVINKFRHYIICYQIFVHTNHSAIHFLMNKLVTNGRVTRWLML